MQVQRLYAEMLEVGLEPDAVTYSILIGAAGKALELELAFEYFDQLKEAAASAKREHEAGGMDEAGVSSDERSAPRVEVTTVTFINLINACDACGQIERCVCTLLMMITAAAGYSCV